jgi:pimeloyl-ACP methyl ester carboxylesterase
MASSPISFFIGQHPRLHCLRWNPGGRRTIILLHGSTANAWWWEPVVACLPSDLTIIAPDLRGHGDSEWISPPAYHPFDYAADLLELAAGSAGKPIIAGHSMGGLCALAFADLHPELTAALVAIDIAIVSSNSRDRFLRRLRGLPVVIYPDLETAQKRFRLMPGEGKIEADLLAKIAQRSIKPAAGGGYTLKFDRETFFGGDGIETSELLRRVKVPTLMVRGQYSPIMTAEASRQALESKPGLRFREIPGAHHHVILEQPALVAEAIYEFLKPLDLAR